MCSAQPILANDKAPSVTHELNWCGIFMYTNTHTYTPALAVLKTHPVVTIMDGLVGFLFVIVACLGGR